MSSAVNGITAPGAGAKKPSRIIYAARWAVILGVLFTSRLNYPGVVIQHAHLESSAVTIAVVTLVFQLMSRRFRSMRNPALSAIADILFVTLVVFYSDGIQSPFFHLYYVVTIITAFQFGLYGAIVGAFAISVALLGMEIIEAGGEISKALVLADIVSNLPYLFVIAITTGVLRERVAALTTTAVQMQAEREGTRKELEIARKVQMAQLPLEVPVLEKVDIIAYYHPAREVGGDVYDFYPVTDERIGVTVADVSGKGIPAALMASASKCAIRQQLGSDLGRMMEEANEDIFAVTMDETFVTMLYGVLELENFRFDYVSAGHMPPIVVKGNGEPCMIGDHGNIPLGVARQTQYDVQSMQLEHGDTLVLYTDGVTDALTSSGPGIDELVNLLSRLADKDLEDWSEEFSAALDKPYHTDDATVVAMRVR